ncbi:MAG: hypothetical protein DME71_10360 [Verrucomicrobia bacterium]|nr:MAG: hypothetical protein DME71_10360 [Verrucomicrobiota bacterium]
MADTESLRQVVHSRAPLSTWFGVVLLFALFGVIVLAVIGPAPRGSDYEETRAKKRVDNLKTLREETEKALTTYGWIDKNKGVARIPIDRAMELTIAKLAQQKPAPAGPIATPEPLPAVAPASPAPAGSPQPSAPPPTAAQPSPKSSASAASPSPSGQPSASPPPQASQSPPGTPSPAPAKTP